MREETRGNSNCGGIFLSLDLLHALLERVNGIFSGALGGDFGEEGFFGLGFLCLCLFLRLCLRLRRWFRHLWDRP